LAALLLSVITGVRINVLFGYQVNDLNSAAQVAVQFPGGVWPTIEQNDPQLFATALGLNPTGRMAEPREIANAVVFLSSSAASFITGTNLVVDGALTRGVQF